MRKEATVVNFSLISHTNVGKTTLARTLLQRSDIGDVLDQAHVTDTNEPYILLETQDEKLVLWDTPGFGHGLGKLIQRLRASEEKPFYSFMTQVWDKITDRPFWCSQQAMLNLRNEADVVLYLVDSKDDPTSPRYVGTEMEILAWIGKPTVVLLNQIGSPRTPAEDEGEKAKWQEHLQQFAFVKTVVSLDAWTRCWIQESALLDIITPLVPPEKHHAYARLREAWKERHFSVFRASVDCLARHLTSVLCDTEPISEETFMQQLGAGRRERQQEIQAAHRKMTERLAQHMAQAMNELITLHGLEGESAQQIDQVLRDHYITPQKVNEPMWSALGGMVTGALGGLVADVMSGGLTFGGGAVAGAIGGGAGAYLLAKAYNLTRGKNNTVRWSQSHFCAQVQRALLGYLAVSHFGRGQGEWHDVQLPAFWRLEITRAVDTYRSQIDRIWQQGGDATADRHTIFVHIERLLTSYIITVIQQLYPGVDLSWLSGKLHGAKP